MAAAVTAGSLRNQECETPAQAKPALANDLATALSVRSKFRAIPLTCRCGSPFPPLHIGSKILSEEQAMQSTLQLHLETDSAKAKVPGPSKPEDKYPQPQEGAKHHADQHQTNQ